MKKFYKSAICIVVCLSLICGSSLVSFAGSGTVSYSRYTITYTTSSSNIYMKATDCSDAYYKFKGSACCTAKNGNTIYRYDIEGGNGTHLSYCVIDNEGPRVGCTFTNDYSSYNSMGFQRTTNLNNGFTTLITFGYKI